MPSFVPRTTRLEAHHLASGALLVIAGEAGIVVVPGSIFEALLTLAGGWWWRPGTGRIGAATLHERLPEGPRGTELGELAAGAVRSVMTVAERRRVRVACAVEGAVVVEGDEALLGRVVLNLLDNAIRYGRERGEVAVTVGREGGRAVLRVADDGPGMAPEVAARVFDRFYRGPAARAADGEDGDGVRGGRLIQPVTRVCCVDGTASGG